MLFLNLPLESNMIDFVNFPRLENTLILFSFNINLKLANL